MPKKTSKKRPYYGDALVQRDYRGPASVCLTFSQVEALSLIAALAKGAQTGCELHLTIHSYPHSGHESRVTVTSKP
jgi:hypothetical protein